MTAGSDAMATLADELVHRHGRVVDGVFQVDWNGLWTDHAERFDRDDVDNGVYEAIGRAWLRRLGPTLGEHGQLSEASGFLVLGSSRVDAQHPAVRFARYGTDLVLRALQGIALAHPTPLPLLVFERRGELYDYVSHLFPEEGEFGGIAGLFMRTGYPHVVVHGIDGMERDRVMIHELTHAHLVHLPIPLWLNEGLATTIEAQVVGPPFEMSAELANEHRAFWNDETIQEFWQGTAFFRPDEGQRLAYHLAQSCLVPLADDQEAFRRFANAATWDDAGEAAANEVYGRSLGDLPAALLGPGDWAPRPESWTHDDAPSEP